MAKPWKKHLDRLRTNPEDTEALEALEAYLSAQDARRREVVTESAGFFSRALRWSLKLFLGKLLYQNCISAWDAWSSYFRGEYESQSRESWPEAESRNVFAAMAARFIRVSMVTVVIGLLPALLLAFQTVVMLVQIWQVQEANDLNRQQFRVGYKAEMFTTLYDFDLSCSKSTRGDVPVLKGCTHNKPPYAVREAALGLATLSRIEREGGESTLPVSLGGTVYNNVSFQGADFQGVLFKGANFDDGSFQKANLQGADMSFTDMSGTQLSSVNLQGADLSNISWSGVVLTGANLQGATSKNPAARLAKLHGTFSDVELSDAKLSYVSFRNQKLTGVRFTDAACVGCQFNGATLSDVSFKNADLTGAKFDKVVLKKGVDFSGATFKDTVCPDGSVSNKPCPGF